ncbi:hypothetical protein [Marinobacterium jannaschii]|uniref:hypothetical protein n=1 Tax=Marinobacterium jannaschii TaxID=64970 RepID=UPI0004866539|nr:hypothetical protein [Marinobacterium jannaschii]
MNSAILFEACELKPYIDFDPQPGNWSLSLQESVNLNHESFYRFFNRQMASMRPEELAQNEQSWLCALIFFAGALEQISAGQEQAPLLYRLGLHKALRCQFGMNAEEADDTLLSLPSALEQSGYLQQVYRLGILSVKQLDQQQAQAALKLTRLLRESSRMNKAAFFHAPADGQAGN